MRRDLLLKAAQNTLPPLDFSGLPPVAAGRTGSSKAPQTRTTIVAFRYQDGIMCAADRKTSGGYYIYSQESVKIYQVGENSVMLGCGTVGQIQLIRDRLRSRCTAFYQSFGEVISVHGQAKIVANCCHWLSANIPEFAFGSILAGVNPDGEFRIVAVDDTGSRLTFDKHCADGSGGANAQIVLDQGWKADLDFDAAQLLAVEAIFHAANRDSGSSPVQVAMPILATVTAKGIKSIPEKQVTEVVAQVLLSKLGNHHELAKAIVRRQRRK